MEPVGKREWFRYLGGWELHDQSVPCAELRGHGPEQSNMHGAFAQTGERSMSKVKAGFFESVHCTGGLFCATCRSTEQEGQIWRGMMAGMYQMALKWDCPKGFAMGQTAFPSLPKREIAAAPTPELKAMAIERFEVCKQCPAVKDEGAACAKVAGCCFGKKRAHQTEFHCPDKKW